MPLSSQAPDAARPVHVEKDGIVIEARPLPEQVEGYRHFELKVTNNAQGPRSLHAKILLLTLRGAPAGQCNVYVELPALESRNRTKACRETALSRGFRIEVVRVYPFLLDRETDGQ